ncbi:MAG: hypothetical protein RIK87_00680 [Fuerstiella sp.]
MNDAEQNGRLQGDELSDVAGLPPLSKKRQVAEWRQISTRKVELDVKAGEFPPPIRVGSGRHPRWRRSDLLAWLESQSAESNA